MTKKILLAFILFHLLLLLVPRPSRGEDYFSYSCKAFGREKWLHPIGEFSLGFVLESVGKTPEITLTACFLVGSFKEAADIIIFKEHFDYAFGDVFLADMPGAFAGMFLADVLFPKDISVSLLKNRVGLTYKF